METSEVFTDKLALLTRACVDDARVIREAMFSRNQASLPTVYPSYLPAALETFERDFSPWGFQYPKYDKPHEFGVKVRLMDPDNRYATPVLSWLVRKSGPEVGIFYTVRYRDEDKEHLMLRYGIDPSFGTLLTAASFYANECYKPRVDIYDVEYMRVLMRDAAEDAGITLPTGGIPY